MTNEAKARMQAMLLEEVKTGKMAWYYVAVGDPEFTGGYFLQARGPTEAWTLMHRLGFYVEGCHTSTVGPIHQEMMDEKIPEEWRWRRLTLVEIETL